MHFQEHHFKNLGRARDSLSETILSLQSAIDRMTGDDWIDAKLLLDDIRGDIGPRLGRLRTNASERFDELTRRDDWEAMRSGELPFPDERLAVLEPQPLPDPVVHDAPRLDCPNAKRGAELVALHGGIDAAMMAYQPDSPEFDHIQAFRYVSTGKRPPNWIPPRI